MGFHSKTSVLLLVPQILEFLLHRSRASGSGGGQYDRVC